MSAEGNERRGAALDYAARGWPVLPIWWPERDGSCACRRRVNASTECTSSGKHPLTPDGLNGATTDVARIEKWWSKWPDANVGLRTGIAFDVLDVDGPSALDGIVAVARAAGIDAWVCDGALIVPDSSPCVWDGPEVLTGRGFHRYVLPSGDGNRSPSVAKLDYRGAGGYVIAPPSLHVSGHRYTWGIGGADVPLEPLPEWCEGLWRRTDRAVAAPGDIEQPWRLSLRVLGGRYNANGLIRVVASAVEGERNTYLNWAAWSVGLDEHDGTCTPREGREALDAIRAAAIRNGLGDAEVEQTMRSGYEAGTAGKGADTKRRTA